VSTHRPTSAACPCVPPMQSGQVWHGGHTASRAEAVGQNCERLEIIGRTKVRCIDIECAVADYFSPRVNLIVPNVSWGFLFYECDLLVVTKFGYCYEVEIKTSRSDLKADMGKPHGHRSKKIRRLYFAIPDYMEKDIEFVPAHAGILLISAPVINGHGLRCKCVRDPQTNVEARKISEAERFQVARLGTMRIWSLKDVVRLRSWEAAITSPNTGSMPAL
jgi:hypothetical protein